MTDLCRIIKKTFSFYGDEMTDFHAVKSSIMEDLVELEYTPWYHIHMLIDSLLPRSYQYMYKEYDHLTQHVRRTTRIGLHGILHDERAVYRIDAIIILR